MFGYLAADETSLGPEEMERYGAHYCGLCAAIGKRCGQRCRLVLRHDLVFLSLLLGSLYEPDEKGESKRCPVHPAGRRPRLRTVFTDYAADLNVALAYHKLLDNWNDDRSVPARMGAAALEAPYERIKERIPRQCRAMEHGLAAIREIEHAASPSPGGAANAFGAVMGELFVCDPDDAWASSLYALGESLGRFVYVMDALCDADDDRRKGSYNPLLPLEMGPDETESVLKGMAGEACAVFERLPLERDLHLLRSVLYSGIWQCWRARESKRNRKGGVNKTHAVPRPEKEIA